MTQLVLPRTRKLFSAAVSMALAAGVVSHAWSEEPAEEGAGEQKTKTSVRVARLVRDLGSDEFLKREKATEDLQDCGVEAIEPLRKAAQEGELEVAIRAISVLEKLALHEEATIADSATAALRRLEESANASVSWRSTRALRLVRDWAALAIESLGGHVSVQNIPDGKSMAQLKLDRIPGGKLSKLQQRALRQFDVLVIAGGKVEDDDVAFLGDLTDLRHLDLRYTRVGDGALIHLKKHTRLKQLMLSGTRVTDAGLAVLPSLEELQVVYLSSTNVTDQGIAQLAKLEHLEEINLSQCKGVTDKGMAVLSRSKSLADLNLTGTRVGDAGLAKLAALPQLKEIYLHGTLVTDEGVQQLRASLPKCRIRH